MQAHIQTVNLYPRCKAAHTLLKMGFTHIMRYTCKGPLPRGPVETFDIFAFVGII